MLAPSLKRADKLRARCDALAASAQDEATRATLARVASRLGLSVVRPLSSALIQSAPNGPYLLTNVDTITDWLGVALDPAPQAALCRCGTSTIKPWCDGSHAQIGFEDAKSDRRVADRLDRYNGLGVAIADNPRSPPE